MFIGDKITQNTMHVSLCDLVFLGITKLLERLSSRLHATTIVWGRFPGTSHCKINICFKTTETNERVLQNRD